MAGESTELQSTSIKDDYMLRHDFQEFARLTIQDCAVNNTLGFQIHPTIAKHLEEASKIEKVNIVDVGAGNCVWLLSLARQYPQYNYTAVDKVDKNFPLQAHCPPNVQVRGNFDAFDPVPDQMKHKFDVVHIRAFSLVIKNNKPGPLIENLLDLLKPGGWIQWDEPKVENVGVTCCGHPCKKDTLQSVMDDWAKYSAKIGLYFNWVEKLYDHFAHAGLTGIELKNVMTPPEFSQFWTIDLVMTLDHFCHTFAKPDDSETLTQERVRKTLEEIRDGARLEITIISVIGKA